MLDLVVPPHCPTCDRIVSADGAFCAPCFGRLRFVLDPSCRGCALPFPNSGLGGTRLTCELCEAGPPAWDEARAALLYDDASRRLILPLKYADRAEHARVLGTQMARAAAALLDGADILVPVPLHGSRLLTRRYDQAALLARAMLRARPKERRPVLLVDALRRARRTRRLAHRSAGERQTELEGAIVPSDGHRTTIAGRRILLVDDVLTTGATARSCTLALREAGAAWVGLVVAARTPAPSFGARPLAGTIGGSDSP